MTESYWEPGCAAARAGTARSRALRLLRLRDLVGCAIAEIGVHSLGEPGARVGEHRRESAPAATATSRKAHLVEELPTLFDAEDELDLIADGRHSDANDEAILGRLSLESLVGAALRDHRPAFAPKLVEERARVLRLVVFPARPLLLIALRQPVRFRVAFDLNA